MLACATANAGGVDILLRGFTTAHARNCFSSGSSSAGIYRKIAAIHFFALGPSWYLISIILK